MDFRERLIFTVLNSWACFDPEPFRKRYPEVLVDFYDFVPEDSPSSKPEKKVTIEKKSEKDDMIPPQPRIPAKLTKKMFEKWLNCEGPLFSCLSQKASLEKGFSWNMLIIDTKPVNTKPKPRPFSNFLAKDTVPVTSPSLSVPQPVPELFDTKTFFPSYFFSDEKRNELALQGWFVDESPLFSDSVRLGEELNFESLNKQQKKNCQEHKLLQADQEGLPSNMSSINSLAQAQIVYRYYAEKLYPAFNQQPEVVRYMNMVCRHLTSLLMKVVANPKLLTSETERISSYLQKLHEINPNACLFLVHHLSSVVLDLIELPGCFSSAETLLMQLALWLCKFQPKQSNAVIKAHFYRRCPQILRHEFQLPEAMGEDQARIHWGYRSASYLSELQNKLLRYLPDENSYTEQPNSPCNSDHKVLNEKVVENYDAGIDENEAKTETGDSIANTVEKDSTVITENEAEAETRDSIDNTVGKKAEDGVHNVDESGAENSVENVTENNKDSGTINNDNISEVGSESNSQNIVENSTENDGENGQEEFIEVNRAVDNELSPEATAVPESIIQSSLPENSGVVDETDQIPDIKILPEANESTPLSDITKLDDKKPEQPLDLEVSHGSSIDLNSTRETDLPDAKETERIVEPAESPKLATSHRLSKKVSLPKFPEVDDIIISDAEDAIIDDTFSPALSGIFPLSDDVDCKDSRASTPIQNSNHPMIEDDTHAKTSKFVLNQPNDDPKTPCVEGNNPFDAPRTPDLKDLSVQDKETGINSKSDSSPKEVPIPTEEKTPVNNESVVEAENSESALNLAAAENLKVVPSLAEAEILVKPVPQEVMEEHDENIPTLSTQEETLPTTQDSETMSTLDSSLTVDDLEETSTGTKAETGILPEGPTSNHVADDPELKVEDSAPTVEIPPSVELDTESVLQSSIPEPAAPSDKIKWESDEIYLGRMSRLAQVYMFIEATRLVDESLHQS